MPSARFIVSGKVQGVFFRASTRTEASRLGLHGIARNLATGEVEVIVEGSSEAVDAMERWLQHGPPSASVSEVERGEYADGIEPGLHIL